MDSADPVSMLSLALADDRDLRGAIGGCNAERFPDIYRQ